MGDSKIDITSATKVQVIGPALLLTCLLFAPLASIAQDRERASADIREYMTYHLGRWQSNTTYFDADGNVTKEEVEGFGEKVLVDGQVNLHFSYNSDGSVNTAFRFYSPEDDKFYMIDVTAQGRWWILSGARGSNKLRSHEKSLPDGRTVILKVTHSDIRPEAFESTAEVSLDGGNSWQKYSHQDTRKIGDDAKR